MRSLFPDRGGPDDGDRLIRAFEALWRDGIPSLGEFWDRHGASWPTSLLVILVKIDLRNRFERGERPAVSPYLERFPELEEASEQVISLVYEEFCLREEKGEDVDSKEFCDAYAPWRDSLLSQLAFHRNLSQAAGRKAPSVRFPAPGDRFARFMLGPLLGKGGMAQVYMATPDDLEEQKVAIKISPRVGREASILAMLDHRNIVSLLSITEKDENGLRGICMPYRPGITLDRLIRKFGAQGPPKTARELWNLLGAPDLEGSQTEGDPSGWSDFPIEGTFYDAVAWIGLCLANALTHAHKHKILHRDVKPANILLAFREGPQLLDFNLADDPKAPEEAKAAHKGGTLPYMAPEQLHAFLNPSAWDDVDSPADLYSLGLVLRELATGRAPDSPDAFLPLPRAIQGLLDRRAKPLAPARKLRPDIPHALGSILAKCLDYDRGRRYVVARDLADDLRRFLARLPLKHAPNTSFVERATNLVRRNRRGLVVALVTVALLPVALWAGQPTPIQDSKRFIEAVKDLNAGRLEPARAAFEQIYKEHRNSAWSQLYYGLTLREMRRQPAVADQLFKNVPKSLHANEAIRHRLGDDPGSGFLLTMLGQAYIQWGKWDDARVVLEQACRAKSPLPQSFGVAASVEGYAEEHARTDRERVLHLTRAVELLTTAVGMVNESDKTFETMEVTWRLNIIKKASDLTFAICREKALRKDRDRLRALYDLIEENVSAVEPAGWTHDQNLYMGESKKSNLCYYRGIVAQGRAVLAVADKEWAEADRLFDIASDRFHEALEADPRHKDARKQLESLERLRANSPSSGP